MVWFGEFLAVCDFGDFSLPFKEFRVIFVFVWSPLTCLKLKLKVFYTLELSLEPFDIIKLIYELYFYLFKAAKSKETIFEFMSSLE